MWVKIDTIPLVLMLDVHFLNCYVPSRSYVSKPPFKHFYSTFLFRLPLILPIPQYTLLPFLRSGQKGERRGYTMVPALGLGTHTPTTTTATG